MLNKVRKRSSARSVVPQRWMFRRSKPESKQTFGAKFDEILRHPLLLLLVGSVITGFLANWFTHRMDEQQKQREATVKTFDSVRGALDDMTISLAQYQARTLHLIDQFSVGAHSPLAIDSMKAYEAAYVNWRERSAADDAILQQTYRDTPMGNQVRTYLSAFDMTSNAIDACMRIYLALPAASSAMTHGDLLCESSDGKHYKADQRLLHLGYCVNAFVITTRPWPKADFFSD